MKGANDLFAMKKLKKSEMIKKEQVPRFSAPARARVVCVVPGVVPRVLSIPLTRHSVNATKGGPRAGRAGRFGRQQLLLHQESLGGLPLLLLPGFVLLSSPPPSRLQGNVFMLSGQ